MNLILLCKVVDNYGDIGVVYRLARSLSSLRKDVQLSLIVSNLESFSKMAHEINPQLPFQIFNGWIIFDWNNAAVCKKEFVQNDPSLILECFQCGRPEWLDEILFDKSRINPVQIINIEYLTAEDWADDIHLLKSGTRSALVKKINFMPGFSPKTAGLILNENSLNKENFINSEDFLNFSKYFTEHQIACLKDENIFCVTAFTYERNFQSEIQALKLYAEFMQKTNPLFKIHIFAAPGLSYNFVQSEVKKINSNFIECTSFNYLPQSVWDNLLFLSDFNIVRGEDSFSRAVLSDSPFVWHAYIQDDEYQLVKAQAILKRMEPFFPESMFPDYKKYFLNFNRNPQITVADSVLYKEEALAEVYDYVLNNPSDSQSQAQLLFGLLKNYSQFKTSQKKFSEYVKSLGNLTEHLLNYIDSL